MLAHRVISRCRRNASNLHWRDFKDEEFSGIWPTMWIERLLCQIYRLCLSHNYISTSAVFIGLTSLSTYSFGHQRLSKKGGIKVLGFKADCGVVELNGLGPLLSHALKESFLPVSLDVFVAALELWPSNHGMEILGGQPFASVVFINQSTLLGRASIRSPLANLLLDISCSCFVVFKNQQKIWRISKAQNVLMHFSRANRRPSNACVEMKGCQVIKINLIVKW